MKEQIEEIKRTLYKAEGVLVVKDAAQIVAEALYNADYRKQEWISVDERLPEKGKHVLCLYPQKDYGSKVVVDYAETADGFFAEQYLFGPPSHWMPLPEPPKGD